MISQDDIDAMADDAVDHEALSRMPVGFIVVPSPLHDVRTFMERMGQDLDKTWKRGSEFEDFRVNLISEEFDEILSATTPENMLKELADLLYVTYGYAAAFGWDLNEAFRRVHASNMSKLGPDGKPIYRPDGKVMKGPNYRKPDLSDLV